MEVSPRELAETDFQLITILSLLTALYSYVAMTTTKKQSNTSHSCLLPSIIVVQND